MELFGAFKAPLQPMTAEEVAALEAASPDDVLSKEAETQLLAETAKSFLGLGTGSKKKVPGEEE
jgi:hypothetical protein